MSYSSQSWSEIPALPDADSNATCNLSESCANKKKLFTILQTVLPG